MPDGWQWDSTLFKGSAAYYERGRLPYAPGFAETLATALGLDGHGRLLDVGCGPGIVTLAMAPFFTEVAGADPGEDMPAEAGRQARHRGVTNARWVSARAEDLPAGLREFRVVVFAQSFHWADRERVAARWPWRSSTALVQGPGQLSAGLPRGVETGPSLLQRLHR